MLIRPPAEDTAVSKPTTPIVRKWEGALHTGAVVAAADGLALAAKDPIN